MHISSFDKRITRKLSKVFKFKCYVTEFSSEVCNVESSVSAIPVSKTYKHINIMQLLPDISTTRDKHYSYLLCTTSRMTLLRSAPTPLLA